MLHTALKVFLSLFIKEFNQFRVPSMQTPNVPWSGKIAAKSGFSQSEINCIWMFKITCQKKYILFLLFYRILYFMLLYLYCVTFFLKNIANNMQTRTARNIVAILQ